jgi:hypothetical protein
MYLIHDRLDDDVFVLQDRPFRLAVTFSLVFDDVEFGKSAKILTDRAFVAVEFAREIADRFNLITVSVKIADEFEAALGENIASVLPS